jgi:hypothetical protein
MGLASFGLEIGIFCDFLYSVRLLNAILVLLVDFLGRALSRAQVGIVADNAVAGGAVHDFTGSASHGP